MAKNQSDAKQDKVSNGPHRWKRGESGNPVGMKKGEFRRLLEKAIAASDKVEKLSLAEHTVQRARASDAVLVALLKKFVPDLKHIEGKVSGQTIADIFALISAGRRNERAKDGKDSSRTAGVISAEQEEA
jgi:hypothetical protein